MVASPSEQFDWKIRYLDIYLFYVYVTDADEGQQRHGRDDIVRQTIPSARTGEWLGWDSVREISHNTDCFRCSLTQTYLFMRY